jgi:hypothetical protein
VAIAGLSLAAGAFLGEPVLCAGSRWPGGDLAAIHVRGAERLSAAEIAAATGVPQGAALASIDAAAVARQLARHPWIAEARTRRLAWGLLVEVVEREPVAVVSAAGDAVAFAVDDSGTPFAPARPEDLAGQPRIATASGFVPGEASEELVAAAHLAHRLPELGLGKPAEIWVAAEGDPEGLVLRLESLPARIVLGREEIDSRIARLRRVLDTGVPELAGAASLDLRFADQTVLREAPPPPGAAQAAAVRGRATPSEPGPSG